MKAHLFIIFCALFSTYSVAAENTDLPERVKKIDQISTTKMLEMPTVVNFKYNAQGLLICQKSCNDYGFNAPSWNSDHERYDFSYDEQGNNIEKIYSTSCAGYENEYRECWKYHSKVVNSYNNLNQLLTTTKYDWLEGTESWLLKEKTDFAYLANDSISEIEQTWDASGNKYIPVRKKEQGWNQDRTKQTTSFFLWENNLWVKDSEDTSYFDQEEKIIKLERKGCTDGVLYSIIEYLYDDNNLLVEKKEKSDYSGSLSYKTEYIYSEGKLIREVQYYLIDDAWRNNKKIEYSYDADGDITYKSRYEWTLDVPWCGTGIEPDTVFEYAWVSEVHEEYKYTWFNIGVEATEIASSLSVAVNNGCVLVKGLTEPCLVTLYTISGMQLASAQSEDEVSFTLPQKGIYLIEINSRQRREILKFFY